MSNGMKTIDLSRTAVILIEFQKEWLEKDGKINGLMEDRAQFEAAVNGGRELLDFARAKGMTIIHSGLRFAEGHPELGMNGLGLRGAIKKFGTFPIDGEGSKWGDGFEPLEGEFVPTGRVGGSAFAGSNLGAYLHNNRIDTILVAGFALHVCVESTVRAAHDLGYDTYVVTDATSAFTKEQRDHVLEHVVHHYGENITLNELRSKFA